MPAYRSVVVVGGGLSGTLLALKLKAARPEAEVTLVDDAARPGRGLAYGACSPRHRLNVPVSRMETGLQPRFQDWLEARPERVQAALEESGGDLAAAFAPRALFGEYLSERLEAHRPAVRVLRGRAVAIENAGGRAIVLEDGRRVGADAVVLAIGNLPPARPPGADSWIYDSPAFVPDPWEAGWLDGLATSAPVLLVGAGLTMIDVAIELDARGCRGPMLAVSRRGLLPKAHCAGGDWPAFLSGHIGRSPRALTRLFRTELARAEAQGTPWQRVFDAARPALPAVWSRWTGWQKRQFLRHLRARWDIHRHRTAPRVNAVVETLMDDGRLRVMAARIAALDPVPEGVEVTLKRRGGPEARFTAAKIVNCTGPATDFARLAVPLIESLRAQGLVRPDPLGLGLDSVDTALVGADGAPSDWLFALGPLTRPAWWEITAAPEIVVQVDRLAARLASGEGRYPGSPDAAVAAFLDMGAGI